MDKRKIQSILLQAQKDNERNVTGIIGKTDDADETTIYSNAEKTEVWVRINGMAEPYSALIGDPAAIVPLARVYLKYDVEASRWVVAGVNTSANNHYFQNVGGFTFAIQPHNHSSPNTGDDLGNNTVGTAQIQPDAVTQTELADDSVGTAQIQAGAVGNSELASDAVQVGNLNNLSTSTNGYVRQNSGDTFITEKYNSTNTAPTASNDDTENYTLFSKWFDVVALRKWIAMNVSTGAAVWKRYLFSGEVVPTDTTTLSGTSAAFVTQTTSNTFSSIDYALTAHNRMYYDGTDIRTTFREGYTTGATVTTSGTTASVVTTSSDMAGLIDTSNSVINYQHTMQYTATQVGDKFRFLLSYNYDNGGVEGWQGVSTTNQTLTIYTTSQQTFIMFGFFDASTISSPAWGYSGTYKLRLNVFRAVGGTGTISILTASANVGRNHLWMEI